MNLHRDAQKNYQVIKKGAFSTAHFNDTFNQAAR
jgi:hypothetical protein